ncbi:molybdopterin-dependent oxidoreductase [Conexibacter woesei]|uniref:Molybdopterin oxidoreductase n=1 Tax=Conexibacter woesei (strain DSM 14684 / CCUG 47730 / CIP 108061 / JCM 11494 / NBRC 100937 / ID131577) TaxID=469383 RepID=D3F8M2_CONWI|nr:molybdopterin-dependent oxidoreductase [Conexibacter woesei]ADB50986.1 molybdopterin oxidoreductase [Conexibacter woesei DSM 14684]
MSVTAYRTCPLCEATCGLELTLDESGAVERVRGDADDVFSRGFLCPKGVSIKQLHDDPDRLRTPLRRTANGSFEPCSWEEAFALVAAGLEGVRARGGADAVALYIGNPSAHNMSALLYGRALAKGLGSRNVYSASTVDQYPKQLASALMFGTATTVAVPDLDRTDHLLVLGANPLASNGSLMTAPDVRGRLQAIQARGGKVVVVDPRRSRTARAADEHVPIRPGTDALLLIAMVAVLFEEQLVAPGRLEPLCDGLGELRALAAPFAPERVAAATGIPAPTIRRLARDLGAAERAVVYGRMGTTTQTFGTTASWLVDVLNVLTGNLDRAGGAMFPLPAIGGSNSRGEPGRGRGARTGRWSSRVRGLGEVFGELPVACLAEEIETPGDGQVRALITLAGNPVVSTPNAGRLDGALAALDFMVSVDLYVTETSRHADVILPAPSPLERAHYDLALYGFAIRNVANYSPAVLPIGDGMQDEWRTLLRLVGIAVGQGAGADVDAIDDFVALDVLRRETATAGSPVAGRDPAELLAALAPRRGPERLLDALLRTGPYGEGFGRDPDGLSLAALEAAPHGIDFGALEPRLPDALRTASGRIELTPPQLVADVARLHAALDARAEDGAMVLIGRRDLRSNNSWMHNLPLLVRGPERCTVLVHPDDAARLGLTDGAPARVRSRVGAIELPVEVDDAIMPGVVSIPHGWGHGVDGVGWRVASAHGGANSNVLADELEVDPVSGNAVLNGIPVSLAPA